MDNDNSRKPSRERHGTKSTNLSDKKSRNDKIHDTLSSGGDGFGIGSQSHRGATSISKEIRKMSNNLRFNTQNVGAEIGMQPSYQKRMQDYKDHETASANISAKKMTTANREALSQLRNSHKNLESKSNQDAINELQGRSVRDSGGLEALIHDFNIRKKNNRINGVQLAPLNHPGSVEKPVTQKALSQNRPSIPLSNRPGGELTQINPSELSTNAILHTQSISPLAKGGKNVNSTAVPLPVNCGLQMPPPLAPGSYARRLEPLQNVNHTEKQNRNKSIGKPIGSTNGSGYHETLSGGY